MKIELGGQYAGTLLVDDDDWHRQFRYTSQNSRTFSTIPSVHTWHAKKYANRDTDLLYAAFNVQLNGRWMCVFLHRLLLEAPPAMEVDHIDDNGLNNQRSNLRLCTPGQNQAKKRLNGSATSAFRGVYYDRRHSSWRATISFKGRQKYLGYFTNEIEAAHAYDAAAIRLYGEFARPNFA